MPYVTDEIYSKLPFRDSENIMISAYPTYNSKLNFKSAEEEINHVVDFIKLFRNIKQENNIGKEFKVKFNSDIPDLIVKMLKLNEHIVNDTLDITKYQVTDNNYSLDIYYQKEMTEEDRKLLENQITNLQNSIQRREKLLSNQGYLTKAPKELVEGEKMKLEEEKNLLKKLTQKN